MPLPFKLGCRPPKEARSLRLSSFMRAGASPVFDPVDNLQKVVWKGTMNGNDRAGCCVACGIVNFVHLVSSRLGDKPVVASQDEVWAIYRTQNPRFDPNGDPRVNGPGSPVDAGMNIQTALEHWAETGFVIGGQLIKAIAFAELDLNLPEMRAAISLFGGTIDGVMLTTAQELQFPNSVWNYVRGARQIGGHCILDGGHMGKRNPDGTYEGNPNDALRFVCWEREDAMTQTFFERQFVEGWAVLLPWHVQNKTFVQGMDMQKFAADYEAITDRKFPVPVPTVPPPAPPATEDYAVVGGQKYRMVRV